MKLSFFLIAFSRAQNDSTERAIAEDDQCRRNGEDVPCDAQMSARSGGSDRAPGSDAERVERRYIDLKDMAVKLWAKNGMKGKNNGFDERKYWAYGCHCYLLGDRPMSEMGMGRPVDQMDNKCKAFKDCQKCVREKHGSDCIGEFRKYTWRWNNKAGVLESTNKEGSCVRELFECDKKLVYDMLASKDVFDEQYHAFWSAKDGESAFDNRDPANCPSNGGVPVSHMCCGGHDRPWYWIGMNKNQCCATDDGNSGIVTKSSETCENGNFIAP